MRDTAISNDQGSTPSSPASFQVDAFNVHPVSSSPEHAGYTLLMSAAASSEDSDGEEGSEEEYLNNLPLDDARVDEALRLTLNSDGANFGSFKLSVCAPIFVLDMSLRVHFINNSFTESLSLERLCLLLNFFNVLG